MKSFLPSISFGLVVILCVFTKVNAQSTTITPGNSQPNLTATSTNNGVIVPKITLTASLDSPSPVANPTEGLLVYNTGNNQAKGFYYWNGSAWQYLGSATTLTATSPISVVANNIRLNAGTTVGQLLSWNGNNWVNTNPKPPEYIDNTQPYLALNFCISLYGIFPSMNGSQPFVGEIEVFGFNFAPAGWALCNGQLLSISENEVLYVLIGTTYGGDGVSNFAVPDLRGRAPIHMGQGASLSSFVQGQQGGAEGFNIDNKY
ncbi:MAG TPA: tail fiber protein [Emticicia sp.]